MIEKRKIAPVNINESIVLVGGGGGVYRIARFLKHIRPNITTIQSTFDHGGHSGILRDERGVLPPGDIRQAILALSDDEIESDLRALLSYRFAPKNGSSLDSATVGNILLTALTEITGNMLNAINILCRWFKVRGKVLPVSLNDAELCVKLSDGSVLRGEGLIDTRVISDNRTIISAFLEPEAFIHCNSHEAIVSADKIVFCPGDLYTSVIPNTLVNGFREAIKESRAKLIYVVNIMNKKSETNHFKASKFAETMLKHIGREKFDVIVCNNANISKTASRSYEEQGSFPVKIDKERLGKYTKLIKSENLVDEVGGIVRHNEKVALIIAGL
ncbi:MAG: uridine diphosphate-N-acetylglucosamine-binding protein YvcK [bacterium]